MKRPLVVALAGGVGAARFLDGLTRVIAPECVFIIGNTADDTEVHGLHISPDLDTKEERLHPLSALPRLQHSGQTSANAGAICEHPLASRHNRLDRDCRNYCLGPTLRWLGLLLRSRGRKESRESASEANGAERAEAGKHGRRPRVKRRERRERREQSRPNPTICESARGKWRGAVSAA